ARGLHPFPTRRSSDLGRAEAALEGVGVDEGALHRMQLAVLRDPFDRLDGLSLAGDGERHARVDGTAVDKDGARATRPFIADLLRSEEHTSELQSRGHL